jgi:subtilisin family serine protease
MKLRHYFPSLAALAFAGVAFAQQPDVAGPVVEKIPEVRLPVEVPVKVGKYDSVRAANAFNWHVVQSKGPEAWAKNPRAKGKGVRVAVLDTGAQADHPALKASIKATYNAIDKTRDVTDRNNHGTHCADTVRQIAPEVELVIVKVLGDNGSGRVDQIAHGIDWAVTEGKADVLSLSLGGPTPDRWQQEAIDRALRAGVIVIAAAGNSGGPRDTEGWPGRFPGVVSVAAADRNNRLAAFSSHGPNVFTVKYGVDIRAALPGNQEGEMSGTSMATPSEAGCAAAWVACNPQIPRAERPAAFRKAVLEVSPFAERNNARGHGMYTLDRLIPAPTEPPAPPAPGKPVAVTITLDDLTPAKREELRQGGVTKFRLEVGHDKLAEVPQPISVTGDKPLPVAPAPVAVPPPQPVPQFAPQYMPGPCPGGVCPVPAPTYYRPAPAPTWTPGTVIRRVFR